MEENGRLKFSNLPWANSNCYLFYTKSFESQIEAKEFCRTAFGEKYIGELTYGIGIDLQAAASVRNNLFVLLKFYSKWNYMKLGILEKIDDFTCHCTTKWFREETRNPTSFKEYWKFGHQQIESIGLKKGTKCPNICSAGPYNITTICELSSKMPENE